MKQSVRMIVIGFGLSVSALFAESDYLRDVKPVLKARCYSCHGALKQKAGLRLDTAELILQGAKSGPVVVPDRLDASVLLDRVESPDADERMPPEGESLSATEIAALRDWIASGAPKPDNEQPEEDPSEHWAFKAPQRRPLPDVSETLIEKRNPIDQLIQAAHQRESLTALPQIAPELLLRRLTLDLVGLPPSPQLRRDFLENPSPDAYERLVERLLASPQYGERWGRHWMDVWRYSDWYGLGAQLRFSQKHLWHWRDWIVDSLNEDKGYDRMILEMLAGDELAPTDQSVLRATGFLARNYYLFNRNTWLEQTIEHTSQAFLGLTMQCAKCHDHKYDPVSQLDYYRFRAFFEPHQIRLDPVPGTTDLEVDGLPRAFDAHPEVPTYLFRRGNDKNPDESKSLVARVPKILEWEEIGFESKELPAEAHFPGLQAFVLKDHLRKAERAVAEAEKKHAASQKGLEKAATRLGLAAARLKLPALRSVHRADRAKHGIEGVENQEELVRLAAKHDQAYRLAAAKAEVVAEQWALEEAVDKDKQGIEKKLSRAKKALADLKSRFDEEPLDYLSLRPSRKALESPAETEDSRRQPYVSRTTGRRTALAQWVTHRRNPLTARVAVNHIWMRHFGEPLVTDVKDFGRRSSAPPMQALLDYLAIYLMDHQWRMKPLHRLIVTSEAYRRESSTLRVASANLENDPDNRFLWRRVAQRMESQVIRDSMRYLAGRLDLTMGGATVDPSKGESLGRRSLYFTHSRDAQNQFLSMFDDAEILACYRRTESIIPQQALALVNSRLALELAESVAERLSSRPEGESDESFVERAFEHVLGVSASEEEQVLCLKMLRDTQQALSGLDAAEARLRARRNVVQVLFNHNDFVTIR